MARARLIPIVATAVALGAGAPRAADFYQGKTINFVINFTAGGPTDLEGRLVAKHLAKHIAGAPSIVVRNMAGAGGAIGVNWLGEIAPADGLNLGFFTGVATKAAFHEPTIRVDVSKFGFVAAGAGVTVTYARTDIPPGLKRPEDIMKASGFWLGGLAPEIDKDIRARMQLDMLGLKYRYISNYPGSAEARLAIERNEIQVFPESMPTYRATIEPMVASGIALPLWYDPLDDGETFSAAPEAAGIPAQTFTDFLIAQKGAPPGGDLWDAFRLINSAGTTFLRVAALPPGSPPEAVKALRAAFDAMNNDAEYRAEALKVVKYVPRYLVDDKTEKLFRDKLTPNPRLASFVHDYIAIGRASLGK